MSARTDISKEMMKLISKGTVSGVYENFGQKEYLKLKNKYGDHRLIQEFYMWCCTRHDNNLGCNP